MGKDDYGPISQYNSLTDPNLQGYYSKTIIRSHLRQIGLINKKGEIIPEEVWRKKAVTKEKMEQASRLIANRIVQQAIEIKNLERAEIRRKLEEVAKKELVRRVRGQSAQNRQLPLLWANAYERAESAGKKKESRSDDEFGEIKLEDDYEDSQRLFGQPRPRKLKPLSKDRFKKRKNRFSRTFSAYPRIPPPEPTILTMIYYGKNIKIPFDYEIFEPKDEISIYQQHCGGENLLIYQGLHADGDKFSFKSRRHKEYPFSLTIYINGTYDCRISTCCEYRHKLNVRIGGKTGRFGFTNVTGDHPCVKCLLEKSNDEKKRAKIKREERAEENFDDINPIIEPKPRIESKQTDRDNEIVVKHDENDYGTDFDNTLTDIDDIPRKEYKWSVIVHTESKTILDNENDRESYIKLKLIGEKGNSEMISLENMNKKNFLNGKTENFSLVTDNYIGVPTHIVLNFKDNNAFDWVVKKIELIDEENSKIYTFTFNDRIKKNHDIKIAVDEDKYSQKKWLIKVFTSDLPDSRYEGTDAKVYISLIGDGNQETEKIWLNKKLSKTKNKNLFEKGNLDEFLVNANLNLNKLEKIRIGHDNSGLAAGWHLQKVEIIDQKNWSHYYFNCERWLSKKDDDGKIERILDAWKGDSISSHRNSKLEIKVKHFDDPDSDAELPLSVARKASADVKKEKTPSPTKSSNRKLSVTSVGSNSGFSKHSKTKTPEPVKNESKLSRPTSKNDLDSKAVRLSANDLINEINNKHRESQLTNRSDKSLSSSSSSSSSKSKSSLINSKQKENADSNDSDNDAENLNESTRSKNSTKRSDSKQSKNGSTKSETITLTTTEKTRRLSGAEVEKIIASDIITQSARSSKMSEKKSTNKSSTSSENNSSESSISESDSEDESFMDVLNKSKSINKDALKPNDGDHLNIDSNF